MSHQPRIVPAGDGRNQIACSCGWGSMKAHADNDSLLSWFENHLWQQGFDRALVRAQNSEQPPKDSK